MQARVSQGQYQHSTPLAPSRQMHPTPNHSVDSVGSTKQSGIIHSGQDKPPGVKSTPIVSQLEHMHIRPGTTPSGMWEQPCKHPPKQVPPQTGPTQRWCIVPQAEIAQVSWQRQVSNQHSNHTCQHLWGCCREGSPTAGEGQHWCQRKALRQQAQNAPSHTTAVTQPTAASSARLHTAQSQCMRVSLHMAPADAVSIRPAAQKVLQHSGQ